jgi:hypothetical protein
MSSISGLGVCIVLGFVAGALGRRILWCCMCNSTRWSSGNISIVSTSSGGVSTVVVNGKKYIFPRCNDISDVGGKIYLDGKLYDEKNSTDLEKDMMVANKIELHIHPIGDKQAPNITTSSNVVVHGNAGDVRSTDGDVEIGGTVTGSVKTEDGNVTIAGDVHGDVKTEDGNIHTREIKGKCIAAGDDDF